jgi:hypothetical protein
LENAKERDHLGRTGRRWEDNIRTDLREIGWEDVDWIHLAPVNTIIKLRVP